MCPALEKLLSGSAALASQLSPCLEISCPRRSYKEIGTLGQDQSCSKFTNMCDGKDGEGEKCVKKGVQGRWLKMPVPYFIVTCTEAHFRGARVGIGRDDRER